MIAKCTEKGCDYVATHKSQAYANAMLGRHKRFAHGITGKKYVKKADQVPAPVNSPKEEAKLVPNFCPNCGCHLRAVTAALNLMRRS